MKKIISLTLLVLLFSSNLALSQTTPVKFVKGWGTELNFNPFNGSLSLNNSSGQIKVRKFMNEQIALRASLTIEYKNLLDKDKLVYGTSTYDKSDKRTSLLTALNLGAEKHFNSGHRLSPYLGFEVGLGIKTSKQVLDDNEGKTTIKNAWFLINDSDYLTEQGYISTNLNLITGFDFYMADQFYFGYEFGFGFEFLKYSKIDITQDFDSNEFDNFPDMTSRSINIGPRLINGIRVGYNF